MKYQSKRNSSRFNPITSRYENTSNGKNISAGTYMDGRHRIDTNGKCLYPKCSNGKNTIHRFDGKKYHLSCECGVSSVIEIVKPLDHNDAISKHKDMHEEQFP
jgi:hypothetical protein